MATTARAADSTNAASASDPFGLNLTNQPPAEVSSLTTNAPPAPAVSSPNAAVTAVPPTNAPAASAEATPGPAPAASGPSAPLPAPTNEPPAAGAPAKPALPWDPGVSALAAVMTMASVAGFALYYGGLTRAKNSGHTTLLVLVGAAVGLLGYWVGGFALQSGGMGDQHAALMQLPPRAVGTALDHELGFRHWGFMGSAGFFLVTDDASRNGIGMLFLGQAAMALLAVTAALGGALERAKILALAFCAYLIGVLIFPLLANWTWGGGWLAQTGRELHLGNGFVDPGGAGVVHQTAGVLALVLAIILGPRHGRFHRGATTLSVPGHNVPFVIIGSVILLLSWMATNGVVFAALPENPLSPTMSSCAALAAVNTLVAAMGGLLVSFVQAAVQKSRPAPTRLCRGLLGGAVASCGCAGLVDSWAAFVIGCLAGLLVQFVMERLASRHVDDPAGATAVHGAAGAWGVLATGLFANGSGGYGFNGVPQAVRGLFFGGGLHQLGAQALGGITGFALVYLLGYGCVALVQKILGNRVELVEESRGLDWSETGALGYQGDPEPEE